MSGMLRFDIFMKMKMDICEKFDLKPPNKDMSSAELNFLIFLIFIAKENPKTRCCLYLLGRTGDIIWRK